MEIIIRGEAKEIADFLHELKWLQVLADMPNYIPSEALSGEELSGKA